MNGRRSVTAFLSATAMAAGCGGEYKPPLAKVHGKVTYKGEPLTSGRVLFVPASTQKGDATYPASGDIKPDGTYTLTSRDPGDGAVLGEHKVAVIAVGEPKNGKSPALVPQVYLDPGSSPITKTVAAGDNAIDLDLQGDLAPTRPVAPSSRD